ncbi:MAG TPA: 1-deoxy-D-xylulose-5-phosphate reductoisomerase [Lentisphaeria bacterium]|nr:MAG: 1-deoxy-D-xylulose-5-phosphate reductoisomerase [Lentisphaerae bacterium GWF2_49_21]HBC89610.1 1-deoxy-D-xylulose-5-phosphate reductoisomerase [Lentisphaeria bacterium]
MKKKIIILGSTGSIGRNALSVVRHLSDELEVVGIAANSNIRLLEAQARELKCKYVAVADEGKAEEFRRRAPRGCKVFSGESGVLELSLLPEADLVLCAIVGTGGLVPVLEAVKAGKDIAIASKEVLVMAGELVMREVRKRKVKFLPVDSEHSAIFQCIEGRKPEDVRRIILTGSGGPFRGMKISRMRSATSKSALEHPVWDMGPKVTIDSATLMNKALEIVEARWLFNVPGDRIDVVIHPQSVIHSMVEFIDGTVLAQMSEPDMRFPIQYALTYPVKHAGSLKPLDFAKLAGLSFEEPDRRNFPALDFAYEALEKGGTMPAVMNAANEVAVERFRKSEIRFTDIWNIIEKTMSYHKRLDRPSLDAILSADKWARDTASAVRIQ